MTAELLAKLGAEEVESVRDRIRKAHEALPAEKCMEGGCDIHLVEK